MYNLINQDEADGIKQILLETGLNKDIFINIDKSGIILEAYNVSQSLPSEHFNEFDMEEFYLLSDINDIYVLKYKNRLYDVFINIGEWGYETRLSKTHITLGSSKFHDFCFQIELSQAIMDEENIYIVKNISNISGPGALCRLYRGLKNDRNEKLKRQELFMDKFGKEILSYGNKDWIVISKIKIADLYDNSKSEDIFYDLLYNMVFAMLLVETIGNKKQ